MTGLRNALLVVIPLAVIVAVAAGAYMVVSGDDAPDLSKIKVEDGRVSCEMFNITRGYAYTSTVVLNLKDREEGVEPNGDPAQAQGFRFTNELTGHVSGQDRISVDAYYPEQDQHIQFIGIGQDVYQASAGQPFQLSEAGSFQIPYVPGSMCNSIAPDLFLSGVEGTADEVNGIAATKYHFDDLQSDFPDRHPSFGGGSDAARFVNDFTGDIWVANEGGYIVKLDLVGIGQYPNGRGLEVDYSYELSDVNTKFKIEAPG